MQLILLFLLILPHVVNAKQPEFFQRELNCLALAIHHEARDEGTRGKHAVANVILNRVKDRRFPNTVCGVVFQRTSRVCQFSWYCDPRTIRNPRISNQTREIARRALTDKAFPDITNRAVWFHSLDTRIWARKQFVAKIGDHRFYR